MIEAFFHAWERRLAAVTTDRVVRPFEWGLDWIGRAGEALGGADNAPTGAGDTLSEWVAQVMADTDAFYTDRKSTRLNSSHT